VTASAERTGLVSNVIRHALSIECAVLMGANYAPEVSIECFCEATIGLIRFLSVFVCSCVCIYVCVDSFHLFVSCSTYH